MSDFEATYHLWRDTAMPPGSVDDTLDELHADIVLADTWVADSVLPLVQYHRYRPARIDVLDRLAVLRDRCDELARQATNGSLLQSYRSYVVMLIALYEGFLALRRSDR